jgi:hypothetical protein
MKKTRIKSTSPTPKPTPRPIFALADRLWDVCSEDDVDVGVADGKEGDIRLELAIVVGFAVDSVIERAAGLIQVTVPELNSSEALYLI